MKLNTKIVNALSYAGLILFIIVVCRVGYIYYHLNVFEATSKGTIDSIYLDWRNRKKIKYSFKANDQLYNGQAVYNEEIAPRVGDTFLIKYSFKDPSINRLYYK